MTATSPPTHPLRPAQVIVAQKPIHPHGLHQLMQIKVKPAGRLELASQDDDVVVEPALLDLVRLRVAQIRLSPIEIERLWLDMASRMKTGRLLEKLKVWRGSFFFSNKEKAALTLAEAVSLSPTQLIPEQFLEEARRYFKKKELVSLLLAIRAITDTNCLAPPRGAKEAAQTGPPKTSPEQNGAPHLRKLSQPLTQRIILPTAEA